MKKAIIILGVAALAFSILLFTSKPKDFHGSSDHSFTLEQDYDEVRKILIRTNALEEIVNKSHGTLLAHDFKVEKFRLQQLRKPRKFKIEASGWFIITFYDENIGEQEMFFLQDIYIDHDKMLIHSYLRNPVSYVRKYETKTEFYRTGNDTLVQVSQHTLYSRRIPNYLESYVVTEVNKATARATKNTEIAIRDLMEKHKNKKLPILPNIW